MDFNTNQAIVPYRGGRTSALAKVRSLDPMLASMAQEYFGIDLHRLPEMSDEELGSFADRAQEMESLLEAIPILERHFKTLIEGQTKYEQFIASVQKEVAKNAKSIDKSFLDVWLTSKGYQNHVKQMGQKAHHGLRKLDTEHRSAVGLELLDFNTALQLVTHRHRRRAKDIRDKVPLQVERERLNDALRQQTQYRKDILTYGSKAKGKGFWGNLKDFFSGN
ncbi:MULTISPECIES: hypothetical protein [unclassified Coleofasciculus]|uniref:hypothetical protein n=1 Tax=unclassified Coleofasciculus TaxID=2692782 RepID=UPI001882EB50|nr:MULTISPECIES: hypothetical protein [unclassified Coleofasciculus]MBE9128209.1 hypothetical protein [Coleofasciculus sp. LEGE 07081]MBE9150949.1 hypothetical protein [Coleofasciculus sp. LEGE 07092]